MKSLVIVESPAKARTISKILGREFDVRASIGHVRDLPKKELGVDVENNFLPQYVIIAGKEKVLRELKKEAKKTEKIYIATDPDREGEAIAYHIAEEIRQPKSAKKIYRAVFHEITERAVKEAIKNSGDIDINKVEAQQARRILDRLVGYNLSPFLWKKVKRGLSAGRVQSVAVRLIAEREKEITSFLVEEYWSIEASLQPQKASDIVSTPKQFLARLYKYNNSLVINRDAKEGQRFLITNALLAEEITNEIQSKDFYLFTVEKKLKKRSPHPPFITSTLQQEAARRFRFPAKKTMALAQHLYEGVELAGEGSVGLITYMRTDSFKIAPEAQAWAKKLIKQRFGKDFVPEKTPHYRAKKSAQEAHEAIRPTYPDKTPEAVKPFLSKDHYNLYVLIWDRFIASQMSPAQLEQTTFIIRLKDPALLPPNEIRGTEFRASGTVIRFQGFMVLHTETKEDIEEEGGGILPPVKEGEYLKQLGIAPLQHFTQPPARYTEASLVRTLEEKGIGRPSTYAAILSTIQDRKYVEKNEDRRFFPTELGVVVNDLLIDKFPELIDFGFTAKMEDELDEIESANMKWNKVVNDFYVPFNRDLTEALKNIKKVKPEDISTDETCEKCGSSMVIRWGRYGRFLACTGYPECKNTKPLESQKSEVSLLRRPAEAGSQKSENENQQTDEKCKKCGSSMVIKSGRFGKFLACIKYPECKSAKSMPTGAKCPLDGGDIIERKTKRGKSFWGCSNYPSCKFASWYKPVLEPCPACQSSFLVKKQTKTGDFFLACLTEGCGYKVEEKKEEKASVG